MDHNINLLTRHNFKDRSGLYRYHKQMRSVEMGAETQNFQLIILSYGSK